MQLEHIIRTPVGTSKSTPILMLHGAWHGAWCYDHWLDDFAAHGYEAHAISLPGHGKSESDRPVNAYRIRDYVAALRETIAAMTPAPIVIAHSMGGYVLQSYLRDHTLPGAVLLASLPVRGALPYYLRLMLHDPLLIFWMNLTMNSWIAVNTPERFAYHFLTPQTAELAKQYVPFIGKESTVGAIELMLPLRHAERVKTPILCVAAEQDAIFTVHEEQATAKAYHADWCLIKGQGHDLMLDSDWPQTAATIREWLERSQPSA